jgi:hypothetical protein
MIAENLPQDPSPSVRETGTAQQISEIAHDLKNCMSILLYWVETLGTDGNSSVPNDDSIDDLKKLALKMNRLVERLDSL